jgi:hypothetical protein
MAGIAKAMANPFGKGYAPRWTTTVFGQRLLAVPGVSHACMAASGAYAMILGNELRAHGEPRTLARRITPPVFAAPLSRAMPVSSSRVSYSTPRA